VAEQLLCTLEIPMFSHLPLLAVTSTSTSKSLCQHPANELDALVTDLSMPGLTGIELARQVREIRPGIPIVLTSGYLRPEDAEAVRRVGDVEVILKPNLVADLGPTLHRLLSRQRSSP
jgi:CheY-like chemotaxis protein